MTAFRVFLEIHILGASQRLGCDRLSCDDRSYSAAAADDVPMT